MIEGQNPVLEAETDTVARFTQVFTRGDKGRELQLNSLIWRPSVLRLARVRAPNFSEPRRDMFAPSSVFFSDMRLPGGSYLPGAMPAAGDR
jgi:hypothetical protein